MCGQRKFLSLSCNKVLSIVWIFSASVVNTAAVEAGVLSPSSQSNLVVAPSEYSVLAVVPLLQGLLEAQHHVTVMTCVPHEVKFLQDKEKLKGTLDIIADEFFLQSGSSDIRETIFDILGEEVNRDIPVPWNAVWQIAMLNNWEKVKPLYASRKFTRIYYDAESGGIGKYLGLAWNVPSVSFFTGPPYVSVEEYFITQNLIHPVSERRKAVANGLNAWIIAEGWNTDEPPKEAAPSAVVDQSAILENTPPLKGADLTLSSSTLVFSWLEMDLANAPLVSCKQTKYVYVGSDFSYLLDPGLLKDEEAVILRSVEEWNKGYNVVNIDMGPDAELPPILVKWIVEVLTSFEKLGFIIHVNSAEGLQELENIKATLAGSHDTSGFFVSPPLTSAAKHILLTFSDLHVNNGSPFASLGAAACGVPQVVTSWAQGRANQGHGISAMGAGVFNPSVFSGIGKSKGHDPESRDDEKAFKSQLDFLVNGMLTASRQGKFTKALGEAAASDAQENTKRMISLAVKEAEEQGTMEEMHEINLASLKKLRDSHRPAPTVQLAVDEGRGGGVCPHCPRLQPQTVVVIQQQVLVAPGGGRGISSGVACFLWISLLVVSLGFLFWVIWAFVYPSLVGDQRRQGVEEGRPHAHRRREGREGREPAVEERRDSHTAIDF